MRVIKFEELAGYLASDRDFLVELGEQAGIGSSSLLVRKCGKTLLVDRGIAFEDVGQKRVVKYPAGGNLEEIHLDLIIFTHIHADHITLIVPTLLAHPEARVVFSSKTLEELQITLTDILVNQDREAKKAHRAGLPEPEIIFTERDYLEFISRTEAGFYEVVDTDEESVWINWENWPGWEFGFTFSGHTPGAFMSSIKDPAGDGMVFTGDVSSHKQETTDGVMLPSESFLEMAKFRECKRIIFVTEATNGNRDREDDQDSMDACLKADLEATERLGGMALFPVFAVNRGPNMVAKLVRLGFKVMVAGLVQKTIRAEIEPALLSKWLADGTVMLLQDLLKEAEMPSQRQQIIRAAARGESGFRPIVTSSATLDQGMSVIFAVEMLPVRENLLVSTGHRFDGSAMKEVFEVNDKPIGLGNTIALNSFEKGLPVKKAVNVRCGIRHFDYSAHDFRNGLVERTVQLKPDVVFVKHCVSDGFQGLERALREKLGDQCPPINWARHLNLFEL